MNAIIYYFTATGNSYAVARRIADELDARLERITLHTRYTDHEVVGFVFPVYHATFNESGIPGLLERFIDTIESLEKRYVFALCTHCGWPGATLQHFAQQVARKAGRVHASTDLRMGLPFSTGEKLLHMLTGRALRTDPEKERERRRRLPDEHSPRVEMLIEAIKRGEAAPVEATPPPGRLMQRFAELQRRMALGRYRRLAGERSADLRYLTRKADRSFTVGADCNGCGLCVSVCPADNIELAEQRPVWKHACENCFACFQWCPREAIAGKIVEFEKRYRHPQLRVQELI
jgi:ferredoxin